MFKFSTRKRKSDETFKEFIEKELPICRNCSCWAHTMLPHGLRKLGILNFSK